MFKLIIFTQETITEAALVNTASMLPHTPITLKADSILKGTGACMRLQALPPMTHPRLTEVTDGTHHAHASAVDPCMFNYTVSSLKHALDFATVTTLGKTLYTLTEVAEGTVLLFSLAFVTFHVGIARKLSNRHLVPGRTNLLLSQLHLLRLLPLSCLLFWHYHRDN